MYKITARHKPTGLTMHVYEDTTTKALDAGAAMKEHGFTDFELGFSENAPLVEAKLAAAKED
jgi:hypothetical protein